MSSEYRKKYILDKIKDNESITIREISEQLKISLPTIRKDMDELYESGLIVRTHGGAILNSLTPGVNSKEPTYTERNIKNIKEKELIGKYAASLVNDNDIIFLDAGTTVFQMVKYLSGKKNIAVLTNSLKVATLVMYNPNIVHYLMGGSIKSISLATIGMETINNIKQHKVNKLFLAADGVGNDGFSVQDINEAMTKQAMLEISEQKFLLVDSTKMGKSVLIEVAKLDMLNGIITEDGIQMFEH